MSGRLIDDDASNSLGRRADVQDLLALAGRGHALGLGDDKTITGSRGDEKLPLRPVHEKSDHVLGNFKIGHEAQRLPVPAAARQPRASRVKNRPDEAKIMTLSVVSAWTRNLSLSPSLKESSPASSIWPLMALIQPFSEQTTVTGSLSDQRLLGVKIHFRRGGKIGAPAAQGRVLRIFRLDRLDLPGNPLPLRVVRPEQLVE